VNLAALQHYATHTDLRAGVAAARAVERARDSVRLLPA
jgi:hypothetical protein